MEVLAAYLACVVLSLFAVRLGVPEGIHTLNDRRHDACLARIADLEAWHGFTTEPGAGMDQLGSGLACALAGRSASGSEGIGPT